jgi:hypothetical protein
LEIPEKTFLRIESSNGATASGSTESGTLPFAARGEFRGWTSSLAGQRQTNTWRLGAIAIGFAVVNAFFELPKKSGKQRALVRKMSNYLHTAFP